MNYHNDRILSEIQLTLEYFEIHYYTNPKYFIL